MQKTDALLTARGLYKSYQKPAEQHVLDGVSLDIGRGEFVAVMGPSGCGKSTLLYILSGMDQADEGDITLAGTTLNGATEETLADLRRTKMGFVFQQPTLLKHLSIQDNIILPQLKDRKRHLKTLKKEVFALMQEAGIAELANRSIDHVSGGQLQRAGICRAILHSPLILFADEPTGALNSTWAADIMSMFRGIQERGTAILLVTHDNHVAAEASRVLFMRDGRMVSELSLDGIDDKVARVNAISAVAKELNI